MTDSEKTSFQTAQDAVRIHLWDWKGQPDIDRINGSMIELFDGMHCPYIAPVPDSQRDEFVVFVTSRYMEPIDVQYLWDNWDWEYEESQGRA
jgi:hypothetical protein